MVEKIVQAGKDNWALILIITAMTGGTTTITGMIPNQEQSSLSLRVTNNEKATACISAKLDMILHNQEHNQELEALATRFKNRDSWTVTMQKDFQAAWIEVVRELHPEFSGNDAPNVVAIQHRYPEGRETGVD